jgi:hypothetical protein
LGEVEGVKGFIFGKVEHPCLCREHFFDDCKDSFQPAMATIEALISMKYCGKCSGKNLLPRKGQYKFTLVQVILKKGY